MSEQPHPKPSPRRDATQDAERTQGAQEDYKPSVHPDDERFDYEERTHGNTRRI
jgi:hypothetical protein